MFRAKPVGWLSANCRPTDDRHSANRWPTVNQQTADSRPTVGRQDFWELFFTITNIWVSQKLLRQYQNLRILCDESQSHMFVSAWGPKILHDLVSDFQTRVFSSASIRFHHLSPLLAAVISRYYVCMKCWESSLVNSTRQNVHECSFFSCDPCGQCCWSLCL